MIKQMLKCGTTVRVRQAIVSSLVITLMISLAGSTPVAGHPVEEEAAATIDLSDPAASKVKMYNSTAEDTHVGALGLDVYLQGTATGDVNGDGIADLIVGAPFSKVLDTRIQSGKVLIYFGRNDGTLTGVRDAASPSPTAGNGPDITIFGSTKSGIGGVLLATDINADGIDDIVLGAPSAALTSTQDSWGAVYIYFGSRSFLPGTRLDLASQLGPPANAIFTGISQFSLSGGSLAGGDVNGDGRSDLLVGAQLWSRTNEAFTNASGAAFLFLGGPNLVTARAMAAPTTAANGPDGAFAGIERADSFGTSVAVGDVNADGTGDIIIGASTADGPGNRRPETGDIYILLGGPVYSARVARDLASPAGAADVVIYGGNNTDQFGSTLLMMDFDGDGKKDLVAGAFQDRSLPAPDRGFFHVFFSRSTFTKGSVRDLATGPTPTGTGADAKIMGPTTGVEFFRQGATADVNGDGRSDLILPAWRMSKGGAQNVGAVFVVYGKSTFAQGTVLDMASTLEGIGPDLIISGAAAQDRAGTSVAAADFDGDKKAEIFVAAGGSDGPAGSRPNSGTVYVVHPTIP